VGRLHEPGFALLPSFEHPHFTVVLPDLSELTLRRLDRTFDAVIRTPPGGSTGTLRVGDSTMSDHDFDIWVDFITMRNDGRIWTRMSDARTGFVPVAGQYAVVGCEDADPAVAQIVSVDIEEGIHLRVLEGSVDKHRYLLTTTTA
jgi:hypothetical protein